MSVASGLQSDILRSTAPLDIDEALVATELNSQCLGNAFGFTRQAGVAESASVNALQDIAQEASSHLRSVRAETAVGDLDAVGAKKELLAEIDGELAGKRFWPRSEMSQDMRMTTHAPATLSHPDEGRDDSASTEPLREAIQQPRLKHRPVLVRLLKERTVLPRDGDVYIETPCQSCVSEGRRIHQASNIIDI